MRICLLSERLTPPFDEGFKNVAIHLHAALMSRAQSGYVTHVLGLTCFGQDMPERGISDIPTNRLFLSLPLRRAITRFKPDVLYYIPTASVTLASFLRARVLRLYMAKGKVVFIALQPRHHCAPTRRLMRALPPDLLLSPSRSIIKSLPPLRCPSAFVPLGVDLHRFTPGVPGEKARLRQKYGLAEEKWLLLHVGHIKRERNIQIMARITASLGCQALAVGSGSTRQEMELIEELERAGIHVISEYLDIAEAYHMADGYLFPVLSDTAAIGIPLSVLEAMACNLPVVSTPFGGLPDLFPEQPERGLWYARGDEDLLAKVAAMREWEGADTRSLVAPYSWSAVAEQILHTTWMKLGLRTDG